MRNGQWARFAPGRRQHSLVSIQPDFANGIPTRGGDAQLSSISVCHCSVSVAGAKITPDGVGHSLSASRHNVNAAVASDSVLPKPTSSASSRRTVPYRR